MREVMKKLTIDDLRDKLLDNNYSFTEEETTDFKGSETIKFTVKLKELSFEITCNGGQLIVHTSTARYIGFATVDLVTEYLSMMQKVDEVLSFGVTKKEELEKQIEKELEKDC